LLNNKRLRSVEPFALPVDSVQPAEGELEVVALRPGQAA
jgi:hypothetical protein